jgi:Sec-independent protein translocase protein TatA
MELLGIGPLELVFIILLVIIIFGPKDIVNTSKTIGKSLNKFIRSDTWKTINQTSRELKNLPTRLMREAGLDELEKAAKEEMAKVDTSIQESVEPVLIDTPPGVILPPSLETPVVDNPQKTASLKDDPGVEPAKKDPAE